VKWEVRQVINKNRWVADNDRVGIIFPSWKGKILRSRNKEKLEETAKKIYALAYEEELYRVIKKGKQGDDLEILLEVTIFDFHGIKRKDGSYDSINEDGLSWFDDYEQQCKISYYNLDGQIVTEWTESFFSFHQDLRPEKYMELDRGKRTYDISSPVELTHGYNDESGYEIYSINLLSDIWFPRVVGWIDSEEPYYDNSELSALNTPRLNRFLQRTKELILSSGGEWELVGEKPIAVDEYDENDVYENYYPYGTNPRRIIPTKTVCIDGVQKEVYPPLSNCIGVENIPPECQLSENGISLEMDLKPRNHWCMLADEKSVFYRPQWEAKFPAGKFATHQDFWPFVKTILEVGQQEEIFQIFVEEEKFRQFIHDVDSGILPMPFLEVLHSGIAGTKVEDQLVADNLPEYIRSIKGMTKVSYYEKDGQLVDKYLGEQDLGRFLYNYHLGSLGDYQRDYRKEFLHPYCGCLEFYDRLIPEYDPEGCHLHITLASDIWFPVVKGFMEKKVSIINHFRADDTAAYEGGFDNRELANRHTPRLNRFLSAIAAKVTEMGGEWSIKEHEGSEYREQMTLTGIKLDV
jgi:hypothetical protein